MVVDDEQIVLDAVKFIIENNLDNASIAETARSGREALEKVDEVKPDIMLMDIRMPGINGLEVIHEVRERYKNIKFIIISAYEQFEFAKEAVNLGVKEYILKPINRYKLLSTVEKVINELEKERQLKKKEIENKEKLEKVIPILEYGFIYTILLNQEFQSEASRYRELFDLNYVGGYIMVIEFGEGESVDALENRIGSSIKSHSFYPYLRDTLKYKCKCVVGPVIINRVVAFVSIEEEEEYKQRLAAIHIAECIVEKMGKTADVEFFIGIGSYQEFSTLNRSYEEALRALQYNKGERVLHIMDILPERVELFSGLREKQKQILGKVESGELEESLNIFFSISSILNTAYYSQRTKNPNMIETIKNKWMELMVQVYGLAYELEIQEDSMIQYDNYLGELRSIEEYEQIPEWCKHKIKYIVEKGKESKLKKVSAVIYEAKQYIDNRFQQELTLEEVSKEISMSPQYFSRLFKEETGENFKEYLTAVRIAKAKDLLKNTNKSVKEISFDIGYNDPNYFSRLFRKMVGVTPTEFTRK